VQFVVYVSCVTLNVSAHASLQVLSISLAALGSLMWLRKNKPKTLIPIIYLSAVIVATMPSITRSFPDSLQLLPFFSNCKCVIHIQIKKFLPFFSHAIQVFRLRTKHNIFLELTSSGCANVIHYNQIALHMVLY